MTAPPPADPSTSSCPSDSNAFSNDSRSLPAFRIRSASIPSWLNTVSLLRLWALEFRATTQARPRIGAANPRCRPGFTGSGSLKSADSGRDRRIPIGVDGPRKAPAPVEPAGRTPAHLAAVRRPASRRKQRLRPRRTVRTSRSPTGGSTAGGPVRFSPGIRRSRTHPQLNCIPHWRR